MRPSFSRAIGIRRFSSAVANGGAGAEEPVTEEFTIAPGHGTGEYEILTIGGVILNKFNMIQWSLNGITQSGGTTPTIALQTSNDGGSTWRGGTDYNHILVTFNFATETVNDAKIITTQTDSFASSSGVITGNNADQLFGSRSSSMVAGGVGYTYTGVSRVEEVCNGFRFKLFAASGTPVFTGGTVDVVGYR